jgi:hypothetical protein
MSGLRLCTVVGGQFISNTNAGIWAAIIDSGARWSAPASPMEAGSGGHRRPRDRHHRVVQRRADVLGVVSNSVDYGREEIGSGGVAIGETVLARKRARLSM